MLKRTNGQARDRRSVPERIADAVDYEIAARNFEIGERLIETQIAERHAASRGSVREALRMLAQRGSVQLISGRGAIVCGYSLDRLADAFAAAGMLIALGARYVARHRSVAVLARIEERVERIERMVAGGFSRPYDFATAIGGFNAAIVVGSENHYVRSQVSAILNRSVWQAMWKHPCDHLSLDRQREEAEAVRRILDLLRDGDADGAEEAVRIFHQVHCDMVVAELARQRGERAPASPPLSSKTSNGAETVGLLSRLARVEAEIERIKQMKRRAS